VSRFALRQPLCRCSALFMSARHIEVGSAPECQEVPQASVAAPDGVPRSCPRVCVSRGSACQVQRRVALEMAGMSQAQPVD